MLSNKSIQNLCMLIISSIILSGCQTKEQKFISACTNGNYDTIITLLKNGVDKRITIYNTDMSLLRKAQGILHDFNITSKLYEYLRWTSRLIIRRHDDVALFLKIFGHKCGAKKP